MDRPPLTPEIFDGVFRKAADSRWTREVIGRDLPPEVDPFSFITLDGLHEIARHLAAAQGGTILDVACGRGGPGLWLARQLGAAIVGVDFSPVGIEHARARAAELGAGVGNDYFVADAAATGLDDDSVDGAVCVDAIQLMPHQVDVIIETRRVLKPGGRAVFTTWEGDDLLDDLGDLFREAGLDVVVVEDRPDWLARERTIFEKALTDAPRYPDDAALQSLAAEAERALPTFDDARRVIGVAEKRSG